MRLCVQLLPAQALRGGPVLDYDLDVPDLGWHAVTLREGLGTFARLGEPRGRRRSDFRLSLDAPALAELLASGGSRAVRRAGRARVRGTLRRRRALASLPPAVLDLGELAEARVWPDPGLVLAALAQLIDPEWTGSAPFAVALLVSGPRGGSWAIRSPGGRRPLVVAGRDPGADVTVRLSQDSFQRMLAGQAAGGTGTAIRGDVAALARLVEWVERARRGTS